MLNAIFKALALWTAIMAVIGFGKVIYDLAGGHGLFIAWIGLLLFLGTVVSFYESDHS